MRSANRFDELAQRTALSEQIRPHAPARPYGSGLYGADGPPGLSSAPMNHVFDFLVPAALLAVLIALAAGLYALFRGGDFGRSYSNKLMRLRVLLQFIAIIVLVAAAFWWRRGA